MQRLRAIVFAAVLLAAGLGHAPVAIAASVDDWRVDLDEISNTLVLQHPDPYTRIGREAFARDLESLKRRLPELSEEQRVVEAMRLVASIGDGHTFLEPTGDAFKAWYPIRLYRFSDGIFVTSAHKSVAGLAGAQMLEIGGMPAAEALDLARGLMGADNDIGASENVAALSNAGLAKGLGLADASGALPVKVRLRDGRERALKLAPQPGGSGLGWRFRSEVFGASIGDYPDWVAAFGASPSSAFRTPDPARPLHLRYRRHYIGVPLPERDAYYMQVNYVLDHEDEAFNAFFHRAMAEVDKQKPRRLIVDWRYNSGGDGSKLTAMIAEFIRRGDAPPWRELYVLTGRKTFSAAVGAVEEFLARTPATFVGEPAGAGLNSFGDAGTFKFEHAQLSLSCSRRRHWGRSDSHDPYTPVDVPAVFSFADYIAGRDPAVDPILAGEEMRALHLIAASDGGAAVRRVYAQRQARFHGVPWWTAARDDPMTSAGYALVDQGKLADALEVLTVDAEANPGLWRAWNNVGDLELKNGHREAGLAAYRRSLQLNPGNAEAQQVLAEPAKTP